MKNIHVIRRMVATMANRLKKIGLTLSAAFKKAWELVKGNAINTRVAGVTKGNRQKALRRIATAYRPEQVCVSLERDRANLCDNNAVNVIISVNGSTRYNLGCIPGNLAYLVSALMDKGIRLTAAFKEVRGHYTSYMNYGAVITLQLV
ncbi:MAG: HIRAN domain-containing protein [Hominilimicola sp.]